MTDQDRILMQQDLVRELDEVVCDYHEKFSEDEEAVSVTVLNFAIKSLLFRTDPLIASELVSSSLAAWMAFARKLGEEESDEVNYSAQLISWTEDAEPDPELLFMETDGVKPN